MVAVSAIRIDFPIKEIVDLSKRAVASLNKSRGPVRSKVAKVTKDLIVQSFAEKSRGAKGSDGITWAPDDPETTKRKRSDLIGIETGGLLNSLAVDDTKAFGGSSQPDVIAAFTAPYAEYFDASRQLLPDEMPWQWAEQIEAPVRDWMQAELQKQVDSNSPYLGGL